MLECMQGQFFENRSKLGILQRKIFQKVAFEMKIFSIKLLEICKFFEKIQCKMWSDLIKSYFPISYTLLYLSKIILAIREISGNSHKNKIKLSTNLSRKTKVYIYCLEVRSQWDNTSFEPQIFQVSVFDWWSFCSFDQKIVQKLLKCPFFT